MRVRAEGRFLLVKTILVAVALGVGSVSAAGLRAGAVADSAEQPAQSSRKGARPDVAQAKKLYEQNCARCHGADGRGQTNLGELYDAPDFTNDREIARASNRRLAASIARGKAGMPSFSKKLKPEEISSLVAYVRTLKK